MVWTYNSGDEPPTISVSTNIHSLIARWLSEHLWPVTDTMTGMSYSTLNAGSSRATYSFNFQKNYFPIVYVFACARMGGCTWGAPYHGEEAGQEHGTCGHKHIYNICKNIHAKKNWSPYMHMFVHDPKDSWRRTRILYQTIIFHKLKPMLYAPIHPE